jgi:hypothetical protein
MVGYKVHYGYNEEEEWLYKTQQELLEIKINV